MKKAILTFVLAIIASTLPVQAMMEEYNNIDTVQKKACNVILSLFSTTPEVRQFRIRQFRSYSGQKIRTETVRSITDSKKIIDLCLPLINIILFNSQANKKIRNLVLKIFPTLFKRRSRYTQIHNLKNTLQNCCNNRSIIYFSILNQE